MIGSGVSSLLELAQAFTQRLAQVGKFARPEDDQHDDQNDDQVVRLKSAHE